MSLRIIHQKIFLFGHPDSHNSSFCIDFHLLITIAIEVHHLLVVLINKEDPKLVNIEIKF